MKQWIISTVAGFGGAILALSIFYFVIAGGKNPDTAELATEEKLTQESNWVSLQEKPFGSRPVNFAEAAERATPVVVHIRAEESREKVQQRKRNFTFEDFFNNGLMPFYRREGSGSGVIYSEDGYIVTNNHVVEFADIIEVTLTDGRKFRANKVGADPESDIAVLKIEASDLPTIEWADSEQAKVGDWVLAIGNPFDYLTSTVTAGIISAKGRDLEIAVRQGQQKFTNFIQTDAAVNPGNSGGALVDEQGRLLGINSAIATPTGVYAGYSFAIPVETVRSIVEEIFRQSSNRDFGFEVTALDDELADHLNLDVRRGIIILKTEAGSAAQFAGLRPFDVITRVNDIKVQTIEEIEEAFGKLSDDNVIELTVVRKGEKMRVPIKLKK
jgi:S1-C subfamily serine protease